MSRAHRARAGGPKASAGSSKAAASKEANADPGNAFLLTLLDQAVEEVQDQESVLSIALEAGEDPGKYEFAEDGDRKKQDAPLPELREKHEGSEWQDFETGTAFVKGESDAHAVDPNDAKQGALGDCYLIAGMAAVARANPQAIMDLIKDNGDGTFDVTLYIRDSYYGKPKAVTTTVDAQLAVKSKDSPIYAKQGDVEDGQTELWAALIEKTVAQQKGSYDLISGGNIGKGFEFHGVSELLTGKSEGYLRTAGMDEDDALLHIAIALDEKKPVTCDSNNMEDDATLSGEAQKQNVYGNHAYVPSSVDLDGRTMDLQNPWGSSHVDNLSAKDFLRFFRSIRIGG